MLEKLTQKKVTEYVNGSGAGCPYCGSDNIDGDGPTVDAGAIYQVINCNDCLRRWTDGYTLDRVGSGEPNEFEFVEAEGVRVIVQVEGGLVTAIFADAEVFGEIDLLDLDIIAEGDEDEAAQVRGLLEEAQGLKQVF